MCIAAIIHKPISLDYLQEMERDNPHGGGVAYFDSGAIQFRRGIKAQDIFDMQEWGALTYPYLLHFRWATHGKIVPELTHPFPLGRRALLGELEGETDAVFIHNGVWAGYASYLPLVVAPAATIDCASDTAIAAYLLGIYPELQTEGRTGIVDEINWAVALAKVVDGKMHIQMSGYTWVEHEGNDYSNLSWLPAKNWYTRFGGNYKGWPTQTPDLPLMDEDSIQTWEDYVRARYGDDVAGGITVAGQTEAEHFREVLDLEDLPLGTDLVSEDSEVVNAWLAKKMMESA